MSRMSELKSNEHLIRKEFKKQAQGFSKRSLTMNNENYLTWMLNNLKLNGSMYVLDVAAGTGILSRALSPHVKHVTSVDISLHMIEEGIKQNLNYTINNIQFESGNVENLPYDNA